MALSVVSSGTAAARAAQIVVPDVVGLTEAAARAALTDFTVRVRTVETAGPAGTVFVQEPAAPAVRPRRSLVTIFLIVNPVPDEDDVVAALQGLKESVEALAGAVATEQAAQDRHEEVLLRLQEIEDSLPPTEGGGGPEPSPSSKGSSSTKSSKS